MAGPLQGVQVIELAQWVAAPGACAILADWGAEVVKVEPPAGDALRGFMALAASLSAPTSFNYFWEHDNRNKKSLVVDLKHPRGREIIYRLVGKADVLVSNLLPSRLRGFGLEYEALSQLNPRLVWANLTGYGRAGPEGERKGFDYAAFWARAGIMGMLGEPEGLPYPQRPGLGDHMASMLLAGAIAAALFNREHTGQGQAVDVSLFNTGVWAMAMDISGVLITGQEPPKVSRRQAGNPLFNYYRTSDGRWLQLAMIQSDVYWPAFCRALSREDWQEDPRFRSHALRRENSAQLIALLDGVFATRPLKGWGERLDGEGLIWAPAQTLLEVTQDPQAQAAGFFTPVSHPTAGEIRLVRSPAKFSATPASIHHPAPELGQHTEEVLLEAGYSWEDIASLKEAGVIP